MIARAVRAAEAIEALETKANLEDAMTAKHLQLWLPGLVGRLAFVCRGSAEGVCEGYASYKGCAEVTNNLIL